MNMNTRIDSASLGLTGFFLLIPLAYPAQVITGHPEAAVVAYLPLMIVSFLQLTRDRNLLRVVAILRRPYDWMALGILFLIADNLICSLVALGFGDVKYGIRGLFLYVLPLAIFPLVQKLDEKSVVRLIKMLALGGTLVATELAYESINVYLLGQSTWFQRLNYAYVNSVSGLELARLLYPNYRPTGLVEHVHASVFFSGIGAIAWLTLYVLEGRRLQLALFAACSVVFSLHGTRVPFGALLVGVVVFLYAQRYGGETVRARARAASWALGLTLAVALLVDPFGTVAKYYLPAILHNDFQIVDNGTPLSVYRDETARFVATSPMGAVWRGNGISPADMLQSVFGFGVINALRAVGGTTDDAFFLQLIGQYGVLGSVIFFGIWLYAIKTCHKTLCGRSSAHTALVGFSLSVLVVFALSITHSPAMQRKALYPVFIVALAVAYRMRPSSTTTPASHKER
jgi:hypothetical protein